MRKVLLLLCLCFSFTAFGQVNPLILNWGSRAEVQVWNTTVKNVTCFGNVDMYMRRGNLDSQFVNIFVFSGASYSQMIYPRDSQDTISWVSHSLFCN